MSGGLRNCHRFYSERESETCARIRRIDLPNVVLPAFSGPKRSRCRATESAMAVPRRAGYRCGVSPARAVTRIPSSRTCKGERGSSKSSPLCWLASVQAPGTGGLGPPVNSHGAASTSARPDCRAICSSPATGSSARSRHAPPWPSFSQEIVHAVVQAIDRVHIRDARPARKAHGSSAWGRDASAPPDRVFCGAGPDTPQPRRCARPPRRRLSCERASCPTASARRAPARFKESALAAGRESDSFP